MSILIRILLTCAILFFTGCFKTVQINTPITLISVSGASIRMEGNQITVINNGVNQKEFERAIENINEQVGYELLTTELNNISAIYVKDGILPYCYEGVDDDCNNHPYKLGRASFYAPYDGMISRCEVTVNYFIPNRRARYNTIQHEILHCLGLNNDDGFRSIMNGYSFDLKSRIYEDDLVYLRGTYLESYYN